MRRTVLARVVSGHGNGALYLIPNTGDRQVEQLLILLLLSGPTLPLHAEFSGGALTAPAPGSHDSAQSAPPVDLPIISAADAGSSQPSPAMTIKQGVLIGAGAGCVFVGTLMGRSAPADTRGAAFITGCALGAPLGAIAGLFAALGTR